MPTGSLLVARLPVEPLPTSKIYVFIRDILSVVAVN
jgi:hypothetical protein